MVSPRHVRTIPRAARLSGMGRSRGLVRRQRAAWRAAPSPRAPAWRRAVPSAGARDARDHRHTYTFMHKPLFSRRADRLGHHRKVRSGPLCDGRPNTASHPRGSQPRKVDPIPANGTNDRPTRAACQSIASCVPAICQRQSRRGVGDHRSDAAHAGSSARAAQSSLRRRLRAREVGTLSRLGVEQVVLGEPRQ